jgi:hypothetical protein
MKAALGFMFGLCGVEGGPEYLDDELTFSMNEVRVGKEMMRSLEEFQKRFENVVQSKD